MTNKITRNNDQHISESNKVELSKNCKKVILFCSQLQYMYFATAKKLTKKVFKHLMHHICFVIYIMTLHNGICVPHLLYVEHVVTVEMTLHCSINK